MRIGDKKCSFGVFWLIIAILYASVFTLSEFSGNPVDSFHGFLTLATQFAVVAAASASLIGLLALNRWVFAFTFPILITLSATATYYRLTLGLSITPMALELTFVNDVNTWLTVVSWQLVVCDVLALAAGIAAAVIRFRNVRPSGRMWIYGAVFLLGVLTPTVLVRRLKAPVINRIPFSFGYSVAEYLNNKAIVAEERNTFDNTPASCGTDSITVLVVIGESLRPDHLDINGYGRQTLPHMSRERNLVSIPKMKTEECFTHVSVPRIVTRADSLHPERAYEEQSFITLFKKSGYRTIWISNQDATDTYVYFMHEADELEAVNSAKTSYSYDKWMDSDILPALDGFLSSGNPRKLAVLHTIGSHWWYRSHYPDSLAVYKPEINSRVVSELSHEQMVNSYDNTILATDLFLKNVTDRLRDINSVVIFISDHGESLGENGMYLHAEAYDILRPTACMIWYSDEFSRRYPEKVRNLRINAGKEYWTDNIFHTVLDAGDILTPELAPQMSILHNETEETDESRQ